MRPALQAQWDALVGGDRLIDLAWSSTDADVPVLWPYQLHSREGFNYATTLQVYCLQQRGTGPEHALGRALAVGVKCEDGKRRWLAGIVSAVRSHGQVAGLPLVELQVASLLDVLDRRRTCRIFQDLSVPDIVAAIVEEHRGRNPVIATAFSHSSALMRSYRARSYCVQFNESDKAFIERLSAEEGIRYHMYSPDADTPWVQQLVLSDDALHGSAARDRALHYRAGLAVGDAGPGQVVQWQMQRHLAVHAVALGSHDYQPADCLQGNDLNALPRTAAEHEASATLSHYTARRPYDAAGSRALARAARVRMQREETASVAWQGRGYLPDVATGDCFVLHDHPDHAEEDEGQRRFAVTGVELRARNNLPAGWSTDAGRQLDDEAAWPLRPSSASGGDDLQATISAVRAGMVWVPPFTGRFDQPTATGLQTATVVGPADEIVHTDALGRIRIQFHWQRPEEHPRGGAQADERSSTWVRVALPSAGSASGHQFLPRVGEEVLVAFLHDDMDRPVVVGTLHNGRHPPPLFGGQHGLPGNRALSGIHSAEHRGEGFNELVLDDTAGQVGVRLATTTASSSLSLGRLQTARRDGAAEPRGTGAELHSDAAIALRAAQGIFLTSQARLLAEGQQLERDALIKVLDDCSALFSGMGKTAVARGAAATDGSGLQQVCEAVAGWPAGNAAGTGAAVVALYAEAGLVSASPATQLHVAGGNHDVVATDHVQSVSGGQTCLQAGHGVSLFAQDEGMQLIANAGAVHVQAQSDAVRVYAQAGMQLSSIDGEIVLSAPAIRLLADDGSYLRIGKGIELGTAGTMKAHASQHDWLGPATDHLAAAPSDRDPATQQLRFHHEGDTDDVVSALRYAVTLEDGERIEGATRPDGTAQRVTRDAMFRTAVQAMVQAIDAADPSADSGAL